MVMMEFKSTMVIVEFNRYMVMWGSKRYVVMMEFKSTMVIVEFNRYMAMWGSKYSV